MAGKTAILTGVTGGWGRAVLDRFLDRGWNVCATTRGETGLPDGVLIAEADLTDADSAQAVVDAAVERFGRVDALACVAGGFAAAGPVHEQSLDVWRKQLALNLDTAYLISRAVLGPMLEQGSGSIVNISSVAGRFARNGNAVYSLTKFGVNGFTEALRKEVTRRHVRVGVLEPGGVATELASHNNDEVRTAITDPFYEQTEVLAPDDIADGVAYMVTRPRHASVGELWIMPTDQV